MVKPMFFQRPTTMTAGRAQVVRLQDAAGRAAEIA